MFYSFELNTENHVPRCNKDDNTSSNQGVGGEYAASVSHIYIRLLFSYYCNIQVNFNMHLI